MYKIHNRSNLKEYKFYLDHVDVRKHAIFLARCPSYNLDCAECQKYHENADLPEDFDEILDLPTKKNNGALYYEPSQDSQYEGHFKTFLKQRSEFRNDKFQIIKPDSNITDGPVERCLHNCALTFRSKAAAQKHYQYYHKKNAPTQSQAHFYCRHEGCNLAFKTLWYLKKHQKEQNPPHKNQQEQRGRPRKNQGKTKNSHRAPEFLDSEAEEENDNVNEYNFVSFS